jgi:hypothetical protein
MLPHAHSSPCLTQYENYRLPDPGPTPYGEMAEKRYHTLNHAVDASSQLECEKQGHKAKEHEAEVSLNEILRWSDDWLTLSRQNCDQQNWEWRMDDYSTGPMFLSAVACKWKILDRKLSVKS